MASGGEQAAWAAVAVALVAGISQVVDRLIARWRPGRRKQQAAPDQLERERRELAVEWEGFRKAVNADLARCRAENSAMRAELEVALDRNTVLRGEVASLQIKVGILEARLGQ